MPVCYDWDSSLDLFEVKEKQMADKIAIIGGGIAGLTAGYLLNDRYDVTLFEKETIRTMSKRYLIGLNKGHDKKAQPPYEWRTSEEAQKALSDKINRIFS